MTDHHNDSQKPITNQHTSIAIDAQEDISSKIYTIRGQQVMLDKDIAFFYGVETKRINEARKRNPNRFPDDFVFQLTKEEYESLRSHLATPNTSSLSNSYIENKGSRSQNATMKSGRGYNLKYLPYVFTESGVGQLSSVLRSETADVVSVKIQRAFVAMRHYLTANIGMLQRLESLETFRIETKQEFKAISERFDDIMNRLDDGRLKVKMGIFFDGQMFDAFALVEEIVKKCLQRIVLIDDYVDAAVLQRFRHRTAGSTVDCYVNQRHLTSSMRQAFTQYNAQYPSEHVELHTFNHSHDRWLIVDDTVYHFGASIKDLGKKWFAVDIITEHTADELIARLTV